MSDFLLNLPKEFSVSEHKEVCVYVGSLNLNFTKKFTICPVSTVGRTKLGICVVSV